MIDRDEFNYMRERIEDVCGLGLPVHRVSTEVASLIVDLYAALGAALLEREFRDAATSTA